MIPGIGSLRLPGKGKELCRTRSPSTRGNNWHHPERRARGRSRWCSALIRIEIDDFPTARRSTTERSGGGLRPRSWWCRRGLGRQGNSRPTEGWRGLLVGPPRLEPNSGFLSRHRVGGIDVELEGVEGHVHEANIPRPHPPTTRTTSDEVVGSR
eukprot:scaffold7422_cov134-Isochrysis_galbana.AAC.9